MISYSPNALFYFPTTILLIDDNPIFLSALNLKIDDSIPRILSDNPYNALELIQNSSNINMVTQKILSKLCSDQNESSIHSAPLNCYEEICNTEKSNYISAIVVDYSMPELNGAELCNKIKDLPVKKIMLTAEADHYKAVELFNAGLIDYFIIKDDKEMHLKLNEAIKGAQLAYFQDASRAIFDYLYQAKPIFNQDIAKTIHTNFFSATEDKNFTDYYLFDSSGSIMCLDAYNKTTWLIIRSSEEIEAYYDIAVNQDTPEPIIQCLKEKTAIPFFLHDNHHQVPPSKWKAYLHPTLIWADIVDYYSTVIEENAIYSL